jgi:hypothetical protein
MNLLDLVPLTLGGGMLWICSYIVKAAWRVTTSKLPAHRQEARTGWLLLCVGLFFAVFVGWATLDVLRDPWTINEAGRARGTHHWALSVALASVAILGVLLVWIGVACLIIHVRTRHRPLFPHRDIPSASPAERKALLARLSSDELWAQGHAGVAAHMHRTMLRSMMYADEEPWESDEPLWDALSAELERRFDTEEARREAGYAIQEEYGRLLDEDAPA